MTAVSVEKLKTALDKLEDADVLIDTSGVGGVDGVDDKLKILYNSKDNLIVVVRQLIEFCGKK